MYTAIKSTIDSVRIISDIIKASKDLRNYNELASAVSDLNTKLLNATSIALAKNEEISSLQEKTRLLEEEIMNLKNWEAEAKDYTLKEVGTGFFAYVYTPPMESSKAKHWACAKCFEDRKIYILQLHQRAAYVCPNCKFMIEPFKNGRLVSIVDSYQD